MSYENLREDFVKISFSLEDDILYASEEVTKTSDGNVPVFYIREETSEDGRPVYKANLNLGGAVFATQYLDGEDGFGQEEYNRVKALVDEMNDFYDDLNYELPDDLLEEIKD